MQAEWCLYCLRSRNLRHSYSAWRLFTLLHTHRIVLCQMCQYILSYSASVMFQVGFYEKRFLSAGKIIAMRKNQKVIVL